MTGENKKEQELKPCPWCAVTPLRTVSNRTAGTYMVKCGTFDCPGNHFSQLDQWNKRAGSEADSVSVSNEACAPLIVNSPESEIGAGAGELWTVVTASGYSTLITDGCDYTFHDNIRSLLCEIADKRNATVTTLSARADKLMERSVFAMSVMEDGQELWRDAYEESDKCPMLTAAFELRARAEEAEQKLAMIEKVALAEIRPEQTPEQACVEIAGLAQDVLWKNKGANS